MNFARRLTTSMLLVMLIACGATAFIGGYLLWQQWKTQAEHLAWQDLKAARSTLDQTVEAIQASLRFTVLGERFSQAVADGDLPYLTPRLDLVAKTARLDFLLATDATGHVLYRVHHPEISGDPQTDLLLVKRILGGENHVSGVVSLPTSWVTKESPRLARQADVSISQNLENDGCSPLDTVLFLAAASAVYTVSDQPVGILIGGILLHRRGDIFGLETTGETKAAPTYRTVFHRQRRILTNVRTKSGQTALGTCLDSSVYQAVASQDEKWLGRVEAAGSEYIAAYEPILDIDDQIVGVLGAGVSARTQKRIVFQILLAFGVVSFAGAMIAGFVGWRLSRRIYQPLKELAQTADAIGHGDFTLSGEIRREDEFKRLRYAFERMIQSLKERDELLKQRTRQQLTQSERLASVGRLAAGVAHEINNPLTGVLTFAHLLRRDAAEGSQQAEDLDTIIEATTRCKQIVRGLLDFSRQNEPKKSLVNLNDLIVNALKLMSNQAKINHVETETQLDTALVQIVADGKQIQDVIVNLIVNAIDAMPDGGQLWVVSRLVEKNGKSYVEIMVEDSGTGIPEADLERIFDPFFTTKPAGKGTGLGLAISYGIVTEHGGTIRAENKSKKGAHFVIRLPLENEGGSHAEAIPHSGG